MVPKSQFCCILLYCTIVMVSKLLLSNGSQNFKILKIKQSKKVMQVRCTVVFRQENESP